MNQAESSYQPGVWGHVARKITGATDSPTQPLLASANRPTGQQANRLTANFTANIVQKIMYQNFTAPIKRSEPDLGASESLSIISIVGSCWIYIVDLFFMT